MSKEASYQLNLPDLARNSFFAAASLYIAHNALQRIQVLNRDPLSVRDLRQLKVVSEKEFAVLVVDRLPLYFNIFHESDRIHLTTGLAVRGEKNRNKTVPDFLMVPTRKALNFYPLPSQFYVEVTGGTLEGNKEAQRKVMQDAGLPYVQLRLIDIRSAAIRSNAHQIIKALFEPLMV